MVRSCSLKNCNNSVKQKYRFFLLPSVKKVAKRAAWLKKCGHLLRERLPTHGNSISLCEGHFEPDQFVEYGPNIRTILKPTAVPTIFIKNPPRVCDAIESLYGKILNDGNIDKLKKIHKSEVNAIEQQLPINSLRDPREGQVKTQISDKRIVQQKKPKLLKLPTTEEKHKSAVIQFLQIKKNCMVMSTRRGREIISTSKKENMSDINYQLQNVQTDAISPAFISDSNDNIEQVEKIKESMSILRSPVKNNKIPSISKNLSVMTRLCESDKKLVHVQSSALASVKSECPTTIQSKNSYENIIHYTVTSTTNDDGTDINIDQLEQREKDIATTSCHNLNRGVSSSSQIKNAESMIDHVKLSSNIDHMNYTIGGKSLRTYSQISLDTATLRKRLYDLEVERDNAMRKYRHLALRLETFETNLRLFLNDDQIRMLECESPSLNTISWSAETLERSAKIRCIVGPRAYEYLRSHEHYPLPSFRTLYRHRDVSKINEYTDEVIEEYMNSTINEVAGVGIEDSEVSDFELDDEHIKIEMLEPEYESSVEYQSDVELPVNYEQVLEL